VAVVPVDWTSSSELLTPCPCSSCRVAKAQLSSVVDPVESGEPVPTQAGLERHLIPGLQILEPQSQDFRNASTCLRGRATALRIADALHPAIASGRRHHPGKSSHAVRACGPAVGARIDPGRGRYFAPCSRSMSPGNDIHQYAGIGQADSLSILILDPGRFVDSGHR